MEREISYLNYHSTKNVASKAISMKISTKRFPYELMSQNDFSITNGDLRRHLYNNAFRKLTLTRLKNKKGYSKIFV